VECFAGRVFGRLTHTPGLECVNAVDTGVTEILYGKAERKGVRRKLEKGERKLDKL
jgi:hypothetical protein